MCELCSVHFAISFWAAAILPVVESVFPPNHDVILALRRLLEAVDASTLECTGDDEQEAEGA